VRPKRSVLFRVFGVVFVRNMNAMPTDAADIRYQLLVEAVLRLGKIEHALVHESEDRRLRCASVQE
jgi:hypothetical protein